MTILKHFILIITIFMSGCVNNYTSHIKIVGYTEVQKINEVIDIIITELDKEGVFSRKQMQSALYGKKNGKIIIAFVNGSYDKTLNTFCIFKNGTLKDICMSGYYDGWFYMEIIHKNKLHKTALAHELFHYFQRHIDKYLYKGHIPEDQWYRLFGYKNKYSIGSINLKLKEAGL